MFEPFEKGTSPDGKYVYFRNLSVKTTPEVAAQITKACVALGTEHNIKACLIDFRGTTSNVSVTEKYEFAYTKAAALGLTRDWRIAMLRDPGDTSFNFFETVMQNSAYNFRLFTDEQEAIHWLLHGDRMAETG